MECDPLVKVPPVFLVLQRSTGTFLCANSPLSANRLDLGFTLVDFEPRIAFTFLQVPWNRRSSDSCRQHHLPPHFGSQLAYWEVRSWLFKNLIEAMGRKGWREGSIRQAWPEADCSPSFRHTPIHIAEGHIRLP